MKIALVIGTVLGLYGCRKGPEDPLLSLRDRNVRLRGTWKLVQMDYVMRAVQEDPNSEYCKIARYTLRVQSSNGTDFVAYDSSTVYYYGGACPLEGKRRSFKGGFEFTIYPDNSYTYKAFSGHRPIEGDGYWWWADERKVMLTFDDDMLTCGRHNYILKPGYTANMLTGRWYVRRLASRELILSSQCTRLITRGQKNIYYHEQVVLHFAKVQQQ